MSGDYFDYNPYRIEDITQQIDELILMNNCTDKNEFGDEIGNHFPDDIIDKFKETVYDLRRAAAMAQRIAYLVGGDDGEDSFRKRWEKEVPRK